MNKGRGNVPKGSNMVELEAPELSHFKGGKEPIFHHKIIKIQDHDGVALVHMNPTCQRIAQLDFV
jgi:hypothetical protein